MREARRIRQIRNKAYTGTRGTERKKFCLTYRETLTRIWAKNNEAFLSELALKGEKISCTKGCGYCCFQHITTPVAHAIAIVDYLYSKDEAISRFISNYKPWRKAAEDLSKEIDAVYNSAIDPSQSLSSAQAYGEALSCKYLSLQIPCPFLVKSACDIYDVRPIGCAAHCSVSPPEWCAPTDSHNLHTYEAMPSNSDLHELVKLAPRRLSVYHVTLPTMVYRLLTEDLSDILIEIDKQFPVETEADERIVDIGNI